MDYKPQVGDEGMFFPHGYATSQHSPSVQPLAGVRGRITRVWTDTCVNLQLEDTSWPTSVLVADPAAMPAGLSGYYFVPDALALPPGGVSVLAAPASESELAAALREAAATLRRYEASHRAKALVASNSDTFNAAIGKAEVNANLAAKFEALLAQHDAETIGAAMDFGGAIRALKAGKRVARSGWNGKGMWLALSCDGSRRVPYQSFWSPHNAEFAKEQGGYATVLPCITMKTATGEILMGWLASQTDQLAEDWVVLDA